MAVSPQLISALIGIPAQPLGNNQLLRPDGPDREQYPFVCLMLPPYSQHTTLRRACRHANHIRQYLSSQENAWLRQPTYTLFLLTTKPWRDSFLQASFSNTFPQPATWSFPSGAPLFSSRNIPSAQRWRLRNTASANDIQLSQVASHEQSGLLVSHTYHA